MAINGDGHHFFDVVQDFLRLFVSLRLMGHKIGRTLASEASEYPGATARRLSHLIIRAHAFVFNPFIEMVAKNVSKSTDAFILFRDTVSMAFENCAVNLDLDEARLSMIALPIWNKLPRSVKTGWNVQAEKNRRQTSCLGVGRKIESEESDDSDFSESEPSVSALVPLSGDETGFKSFVSSTTQSNLIHWGRVVPSEMVLKASEPHCGRDLVFSGRDTACLSEPYDHLGVDVRFGRQPIVLEWQAKEKPSS